MSLPKLALSPAMEIASTESRTNGDYRRPGYDHDNWWQCICLQRRHGRIIKREVEEVTLQNSELVFVGYGVNAPEYDWNDYEGLDLTGKTAVILVNDHGFENPESGKFQGTTMTYYGRWSYKYEEASRQGAAGAIIIHETAPASYGWSVVANSWSGPQYGLVSKDKGASRVAVEGWLTLDAAKKSLTMPD